MMDGQTDDERWADHYPIRSPGAVGPGELKKNINLPSADFAQFCPMIAED